MAKALQSSAWMSFSTVRRSPLFYSRELITDCLKELTSQSEDWWRWFDSCAIEPYVLNYEDLISDVPASVAKIAQWLDVDCDMRAKMVLPKLERQSDNVNREWAERFMAEAKSGYEFTR
jgi:LPS sulfotransferase NodH